MFMNHSEAEKRLGLLVEATGKPQNELTPADLLDIAVNFYEMYPCDGCDPQEDADMLLFQCGVYDWGEGKNFEVDFVRQFILNDDDGEYDHIEMIRFTFYYPATLTEGRSIEFRIWSKECSSLAEFRQKVTEAHGFRLALNMKPKRTMIRRDRV
jgi:hypothetical protein